MSYHTEARPRLCLPLNRKLAFILILAFACLRFCHLDLLWADEDYHLAAAINLLHGKVPYRDFWYDKPPLTALYYLLIGGYSGWLLRLLDATYVLVACRLVYGLARHWWGEAEGLTAALLLSFFLAFYLPSAVIAFAADAVMIVPHLAAIYCAQRRRAVAAGAFCGLAFLANTKAVFVLATCGLWLLPQVLPLFAGFCAPVLLTLAVAWGCGAWPGYVEQVWHWGVLYTRGTPVTNPFRTGLTRTANWAGFHALLVAGSVVGLVRSPRSDRWKLGAWILLSFVGVALGSRFAPHYFLQLLPPLAVAASHGIMLAWRRYGRCATVAFGLLAAVPAIRFGPRYVSLAADALVHRDPRWTDVTLDVDSRHAAAKIRSMAHTGDTLLVWGYRPDIYVYTRLVSDSRFWDSQPLTGVPADRHLSAVTSIYHAAAPANRKELTRSHPTFLADGLSLMNPHLAPDQYPELKDWLAGYKLVARTPLCLIYERMPLPSATRK
jgi:Dolichyl-phosphate-mannose-protein mannosyltransferase